MISRQSVVLLLATVLAVTIQARPGEAGPLAQKLRANAPLSADAIIKKMDNLAMKTKPEKEAGEEVQKSKIKEDEDVTRVSDNIDFQLSTIADRDHSLRTAGCTNDYEFTYVPLYTSLRFRNHLKRFTKEKKTICGWWFWTDVGNNLHITCESIDLRAEDYMVIYNAQTGQQLGIAGAHVATDYDELFESTDVVVGLETTLANENRTFECEISAISFPKLVLIGGKTGSNILLGSYVDVQGTPFAETIAARSLPISDSALAVKDGTLYMCGGAKSPLGMGRAARFDECKTLDLTVDTPSYVTLMTDDAIAIKTYGEISLFALDEGLLLVGDTQVLRMGYDGGVPVLDDTPLPGTAGCGAGDDTIRFVMLHESDVVTYNSEYTAGPLTWSNVSNTLEYALKGACCFYHEETFYIAGGYYEDQGSTWVVSNKTYAVKSSAVTVLPDLTTPFAYCAMGLIDGKVAVLGGMDDEKEPTGNAQVLDGEAWLEIPDYLVIPVNNPGYLRTGLKF